MAAVFIFEYICKLMTRTKKINIISFNVPLPANYGGVIDVFYKIKTLTDLGFEIILHCFQYGRPVAPELKKYCKEVHYYPRSSGFKYLFSDLPYVVVTRANKDLRSNLLLNNYPILFEGLHTSLLLQDKEISNRKTIIRMHNIEDQYYAELSKATRNPLKKIYFKIESSKLKKYEKMLPPATGLAAISKNDYNYFSKKHANTAYIPAFHSSAKVESQTGRGSFFLYHGNLAVEENEKAVLFLINHVFNKVNPKLIIAGSSPSRLIQKHIPANTNIQLVANPSDDHMKDLIRTAHCCVIPTFQSTGLKLKLLNSLFQGRMVLTNKEMVENTGLESVCETANSSSEFIEKVNQIESAEFTEADLEKRKTILKDFSNQSIGHQLASLIRNL